jgi:1-deoxyxylulose-5-phosphate synthase
MNQVRLGRTGLKISELVLGCMSYGEPGRCGHTSGQFQDR